MKAGRELDAEVAEKVMAYTSGTIGPDDDKSSVLFHPSGYWIGLEKVPRYSTDIAAAWEIVKKFVPYIKIDARGDGNGNWSCSVWVGGPEIIAYAKTPMLAICLAALKAWEAAR